LALFGAVTPPGGIFSAGVVVERGADFLFVALACSGVTHTPLPMKSGTSPTGQHTLAG
jgi:hypothetical protein